MSERSQSNRQRLDKRARPTGHKKTSWEARGGRSRRQFSPSNSLRRTKQNVQPPTPQCSVCQEAEPKYKCPKCRVTYCSISCYRKHKEENCVPSLSSNPIEQPKTSKYATIGIVNGNPIPIRKRERSDFEDLDDDWKMNGEMIQKMQKSDWLRGELADSGLQHLIQRVVFSSNIVGKNNHTEQEFLLENLKKEYPQFKRFLDKLLVITGVLQRQCEDAEMGLSEWLEKDVEDTHPLLLKPLARIGRPQTLSPVQDDSSETNLESENGSGSDDDCSDGDATYDTNNTDSS